MARDPLFTFPPAPAPPSPLRRHRRWIDAVARAIAASPGVVLAVVAVVVAVAAVEARSLGFEPARFGSASALAARQQEHRVRWGADDGVLVAVVTTSEPSDRAVSLVQGLTDDAVDAVPGIRTARSATSQPVVGQSSAGPTLGPAFGPRSPFAGNLFERAALARASRLGAASLVSADARTFAVAVETEESRHTYDQLVEPADRFRAFVEQRVAESGLAAEVDFAGVAYTHVASVGQTQRDLARLVPLAALVMTVILWFALRRATAVLATLVTATAAMVVTAGAIGMLGHSITQVTPVYPVVLLAVVVSGSTHLVHRYFAELRAGLTAADAVHRTVFHVGPPAFACAVTTAAGFASLALADIDALRQFGIQAAIGVMVAFALQLTVIPAVLVWRRVPAPARPGGQAPIPAPAPTGAPGRQAVAARWTRRYGGWVTRPEVARVVVAFGIVVCVLGVFVARTARYDYRAADALGPAHPVTIGNDRIGEQLGGIIPLDIGVSGDPGDLRRLDHVRRLDEIASWLDQREGVRTIGLPALLREQSRVLAGRDELPRTQAELDASLAVLERVAGADLATVVDAEFATARLRAVAPDRGAQHFGALAVDADALAAAGLAGTDLRAGLTGEAIVAYDGMIRLTSQLVASTLAAMVIVLVTVVTLFRSARLALVAFLPNAFPIIVGFAGYRLSSDVLDPLPSVVFCIALGLAADDTIHLISRWRELDRTGFAKVPDRSRQSLVQALADTRPAMMASTVVLAAGFAVLAASDLVVTRRIGGLGTYLLLLALLADLVFGVAGLALLARGLDRRRARGPVALSRSGWERSRAAVVPGTPLGPVLAAAVSRRSSRAGHPVPVSASTAPTAAVTTSGGV
jgi:predicted RND superfamily exporter protein